MRAPGGSCGPADGPTENKVDEYLKLKALVEEIGDDVYKAMGGNKAAGTRVRKAMQDIKNTAQAVRKRVLDIRSPGSAERGDGETPSAPAHDQGGNQ
ncbi:MAG: hypothetical protein GX547_13560 [Phycisphaerae bacterium]|nr:hypothetical protein [Phycisphaerae bacterium]